MIYAEYNGSSPLLPSVKDFLKKRMETHLFGNPNAIHSIGQKLSSGMEKSRTVVAEKLGCHPDQVIFNSGASEGISNILFSILEQRKENQNIIITSPIEHAVIPNALNYYQTKKGFQVEMVQIDEYGRVIPESLEKLLSLFGDKVALVTIMAVNNETGVFQPFELLAEICKSRQVEFFSDTTQLIGKAPFNFLDSNLDYAVCSGHKLGALTGSGFMLVKDPTQLLPLVFGSTQEKGHRGGTQHYLGIETLAIALKEFAEHLPNLPRLEESKFKFENDIKNTFPQARVFGDQVKRLPGTTLIGIPGIHGQAIQIELESNDIFVATSAACSDNQPETSKVLKAMGVTDDVGRGVIRISLGCHQGEAEYALLAKNLKAAYNKLSKIHSY
jgi:cysteine desulfurase